MYLHSEDLGNVSEHLRRLPYLADIAVDINHPSRDHFTIFAVLSKVSLVDETALVDEWAELFHETYSDREFSLSDEYFFQGWNDSHGRAFTPSEMAEWRDATISRIASQELGDTLEIGCGTGMLVANLASSSRSYIACDVAPQAIESVRRLSQAIGATNVSVCVGSAEILSGLADASLDTIIINSVAQYFPSCQYLNHLMCEASRVLRRGGAVYLGDIRDMRLAAAHTAWKLRLNDQSELSLRAFREVISIASQERELLISPKYFYYDLQYLIPGVSIDIQLKRGHSNNELTRYRYDVRAIPSPTHEPAKGRTLRRTWGEPDTREVEDVLRLLETDEPDQLWISMIPNMRLCSDRETLFRLSRLARPAIMEEPFTSHQDIVHSDVDPERFWQLGSQLPLYTVKVVPRHDHAFYYDVGFVRSSEVFSAGLTRPVEAIVSHITTASATDPRVSQCIQELTRETRRRLREMKLSHITFEIIAVPYIPRYASGELDHVALNQNLVSFLLPHQE